MQTEIGDVLSNIQLLTDNQNLFILKINCPTLNYSDFGFTQDINFILIQTCQTLSKDFSTFFYEI